MTASKTHRIEITQSNPTRTFVFYRATNELDSIMQRIIAGYHLPATVVTLDGIPVDPASPASWSKAAAASLLSPRDPVARGYAAGSMPRERYSTYADSGNPRTLPVVDV